MIRVGLDVHDSILGLPPEASRLLVQRAVGSGLDYLVVGDHVSFRGGQGFDGIVSATLALASRDDAIVPAAISEAIWKETGIVWSPDGGHVLPLRHPRWCARHVLEFAHVFRPRAEA